VVGWPINGLASSFEFGDLSIQKMCVTLCISSQPQVLANSKVAWCQDFTHSYSNIDQFFIQGWSQKELNNVMQLKHLYLVTATHCAYVFSSKIPIATFCKYLSNNIELPTSIAPNGTWMYLLVKVLQSWVATTLWASTSIPIENTFHALAWHIIDVKILI
jgi:hypothetical protein